MPTSYRKLNHELIRQRASDIRSNIVFLRGQATRPDEDFLSDDLAIRACRYAFIVISEAAANICSHTIAKLLGRTAETYGGCYSLLAENELITPDLANRLRKVAGFRNLLVHGYARIDDRQTLQIMRHSLGDMEDFLTQIFALTLQGTDAP